MDKSDTGPHIEEHFSAGKTSVQLAHRVYFNANMEVYMNNRNKILIDIKEISIY